MVSDTVLLVNVLLLADLCHCLVLNVNMNICGPAVKLKKCHIDTKIETHATKNVYMKIWLIMLRILDVH